MGSMRCTVSGIGIIGVHRHYRVRIGWTAADTVDIDRGGDRFTALPMKHRSVAEVAMADVAHRVLMVVDVVLNVIDIDTDIPSIRLFHIATP